MKTVLMIQTCTQYGKFDKLIKFFKIKYLSLQM